MFVKTSFRDAGASYSLPFVKMNEGVYRPTNNLQTRLITLKLLDANSYVTLFLSSVSGRLEPFSSLCCDGTDFVKTDEKLEVNLYV
jgi:hypothetical protein